MTVSFGKAGGGNDASLLSGLEGDGFRQRPHYARRVGTRHVDTFAPHAARGQSKRSLPSIYFVSAFVRIRSIMLPQPPSMPFHCSAIFGSKAMEAIPRWTKLRRVAPFSSFRRYCTLFIDGYDIKSGPEISSRVGALIACTFPHQWPAPSPRSRNQRPPGHGSSFIERDSPVGRTLLVPSSSSIVSKTTSIGAAINSSRVNSSVWIVCSATVTGICFLLFVCLFLTVT